MTGKHNTYKFIIIQQDCLVKQQMTTQKADALLSNVVKQVDNVAFDVKLAVNFIQDQIAVMPLASDGEILDSKDLPGFATIYILDAVVAKVQVALDDWFTKAMVGASDLYERFQSLLYFRVFSDK